MILFTANWCTQCKPIKKFIEESDQDIDIEIVDIDKQMDIAKEYGIRGIPAMVKGQELFVGQQEILNELKGGVSE